MGGLGLTVAPGYPSGLSPFPPCAHRASGGERLGAEAVRGLSRDGQGRVGGDVTDHAGLALSGGIVGGSGGEGPVPAPLEARGAGGGDGDTAAAGGIPDAGRGMTIPTSARGPSWSACALPRGGWRDLRRCRCLPGEGRGGGWRRGCRGARADGVERRHPAFAQSAGGDVFVAAARTRRTSGSRSVRAGRRGGDGGHSPGGEMRGGGGAGAEARRGGIDERPISGKVLATRDLMQDLRAADPFRQGGGRAFEGRPEAVPGGARTGGAGGVAKGIDPARRQA